jgi:hypothetical protein
MRKIAMIAWMFAGTAHAGCWKVTDLHGPAVFAADGYSVKEDRYSSDYSVDEFIVMTKGDRAFVTGHQGMECRALANTTAMCISRPFGGYISALWSVDEKAGTVMHVKTTVGVGAIDGARIFIGKIVETCR